jgi:hypothetical protein
VRLVVSAARETRWHLPRHFDETIPRDAQIISRHEIESAPMKALYADARSPSHSI